MTSPRRKRARKYISLREKLAAALSMLLPAEQRDELRERKVPAKSVIALFEQDHGILHAMGGEDRWFNLTPMLRAVHREKARRDTSIVAKSKRIVAAEAEHQARMQADLNEMLNERLVERVRRRAAAAEKRPARRGEAYWQKKRELQSRWPKGRKLRGRGFQSRGNGNA